MAALNFAGSSMSSSAFQAFLQILLTSNVFGPSHGSYTCKESLLSLYILQENSRLLGLRIHVNMRAKNARMPGTGSHFWSRSCVGWACRCISTCMQKRRMQQNWLGLHSGVYMLISIKEESTGPSYMHKFINMHCNSKTLFKDFTTLLCGL